MSRVIRCAALVSWQILLCADAARAEPVTMSAHVRTDNPGGDVSQLVPGDLVWFDLAVAVDPAFDPFGRPGVGNEACMGSSTMSSAWKP